MHYEANSVVRPWAEVEAEEEEEEEEAAAEAADVGRRAKAEAATASAAAAGIDTHHTLKQHPGALGGNRQEEKCVSVGN